MYPLGDAFRGIPVPHMVEPYGGIGLRHHTGFFAQFTQCGVFRVLFTVDVYTGAIFSVEDRRVALTRNDGGTTTIRRQVIHHGHFHRVWHIFERIAEPQRFNGAVWRVDQCRPQLCIANAEHHQVIHHAPCVVMLVHDTVRDTYLVEREYRAGSTSDADCCSSSVAGWCRRSLVT